MEMRMGMGMLLLSRREMLRVSEPLLFFPSLFCTSSLSLNSKKHSFHFFSFFFSYSWVSNPCSFFSSVGLFFYFLL